MPVSGDLTSCLPPRNSEWRLSADSTTLAGEGAAASSGVVRVPCGAFAGNTLLRVALLAVIGISHSEPFSVGTAGLLVLPERAAGLLGG